MTEFDTYERRLWRGRAVAYEHGFARLTAYTTGFLLDAAHVASGTRLLDVGTGPGTIAAAAASRGARVTAIDADAGMVERAAHNVPGLDVRVAILPDLPFNEATFDAVVGNFVISNVGEPLATLAGLRQVLRPGGRLALTCWRFPASRATMIFSEAIEHAGVSWPDDLPIPPFHPYGEPDMFLALLGKAGFTDTAVDEVTWEHVVDPEEWWKGPLAGVGSHGFVITRQNSTTVERIKEAYDRLVASYAIDDGRVALPASALLGHGRARRRAGGHA